MATTDRGETDKKLNLLLRFHLYQSLPPNETANTEGVLAVSENPVKTSELIVE